MSESDNLRTFLHQIKFTDKSILEIFIREGINLSYDEAITLKEDLYSLLLFYYKNKHLLIFKETTNKNINYLFNFYLKQENYEYCSMINEIKKCRE